MNAPTPVQYRFQLWKYLSDNHGLTLLESELDEIVRAVENESGAAKQLNACRVALVDIRDHTKDIWTKKKADIALKQLVKH